MAEASDIIDSNPTGKYAFRFTSSDQLIHLTQHQLDLIPYLSTLVAHKNDFLSIQNENGEYVLDYPINYHCLAAILRAISSRNPYKLFDELPSDENVLDTLQLLDYLGIQSFPLPLLRTANLVRSKSHNNEDLMQRVIYHQATLPEARQTAAEFVVALAKNEYKLHDSKTMNRVFNLIRIILFNAGIFNLRFRDHTLTIVKKRCYSFFSKNQQHQLEISHRLPQYKKINSNKFRNTFNWRGVYVPIKDIHANSCSTRLKDTTTLCDERHMIVSDTLNQIDEIIPEHEWISVYEDLVDVIDEFIPRYERISVYENLLDGITIRDDIYPFGELLFLFENYDYTQISTEELKIDRKKEEAQSARSQRFKTLSSKPTVDRFKHRCGPKAQKYR